MIQTPAALPAKTILGTPVVNDAGEDLGKIEDLMVDLERGRIAYAVLSAGGFLGVGGKCFAVPWDALKSFHGGKFILNVNKRAFRDAPSFDRSRWPEMADRRWQKNVYEYYGYEPYWEEAQQP